MGLRCSLLVFLKDWLIFSGIYFSKTFCLVSYSDANMVEIESHKSQPKETSKMQQERQSTWHAAQVKEKNITGQH